MTFDEWWDSRTWAGDESLRIIAGAAWRAAQETIVDEFSTKPNNRSDEIADSIEAACFPEKGCFISPRESWMKEWCRQLRTVR